MRVLSPQKLLEILQEEKATAHFRLPITVNDGDLRTVFVDDLMNLEYVSQRINEYCSGPTHAIRLGPSTIKSSQ